MSGEGRPLPIVDGVLATPRVARMLTTCWPGIEAFYRTNGARVPPELAAFFAGCAERSGRVPAGIPGIPPKAEAGTVAGMTTDEVATMLGCSARNVRALRSRGRLLGRRHRNTWHFDRVDVQAYIDERRAGA